MTDTSFHPQGDKCYAGFFSPYFGVVGNRTVPEKEWMGYGKKSYENLQKTLPEQFSLPKC